MYAVRPSLCCPNLASKDQPIYCPVEPVSYVVRPSLCCPHFACGKQSISLPSWTCLVCCQAKPLISKLPLYTKASSIAQLGLSCMLSGQASAVQILPAKTSPIHCPAEPVSYVVRPSLCCPHNFACKRQLITLPRWTCLACCQPTPASQQSPALFSG